MKKLYTILLAALFSTSIINAQKTIFTENFGGNFAHNESLSTNSSGYAHTGAGDFVHKIISGSGASGSNCFAQLGASGNTVASTDIQLYAGNTYEYKAYVKTVNSRIYVTLRINSGGTDVATSGNTSANGSWQELSCTYTPAADEMASFQFVKTQGQLANIDKIKVVCTSCTDQNYVFDFNDSKEGWLSGGGSNVTLGNDAMNINATGTNALVRSGNLTADLNIDAANYDRARVTFRTPYAAGGAGAGKLYFYNLAAGNSQFAVFDITRDAANTSTFQTVEIDLSSTPTTGTYSGPIARLGFRAPWGIASGDVCHLQKIELYNNPPAPIPALTLTGIMDFGLSGSSGKALMLTANQSISDLSVYGMGSANNGGGTDNQEYTFPAVSVSAGEHIVVCRDQAALSSYFAGCLEQFNGALLPTNIIENSSFPDGNGNDAYELFHNGTVIETYGDITFTGGSSNYNLPWVYRDSWAWKDTAAANVGNWVYGGDNCSDNSSSTQTSNCPFPLATTACVATYDVTLKVNTANITVGANGMYAGGGFLGGSDALQLTDADGDGTWEGVATISAGSGPNYYAFFNSPSHGSDWNTKENLAGQTCGISSNYNDRVLPTITSDTTIQHCYGNCAFDGTCIAPVSPTFDLTLSVNTASITVGSNGMYAGGGVLGDAMAVQLFDADGDGTWTGTVTMNTGVTGNYIFLNSPSNGGDWNAKEDLTGLACSDPNNYNDRILPYISADTTMLHCFGSCETDGTCPAPPSVFFDVTFQVDASNITVGANGMYAGGGVLGDAMAYPLSDADGDGVWEATISLADGTSGNYIFLNSPTSGGDWAAKEDLTGLACSDPANYNDRILAAVTADATLPVVCFGTCDATCPNYCAVNGTYNYGNNENVSNAVGFTANAGDYITLDFTAGATENGWDYWFVNDAADGTGNTLATGTGSIIGSNTSTTGEISFYVVSDGSVTGQTFVYSVYCSSPPSCPDPSGLTSSNITSSSLDVSWTAGGSETAWNIEYGVSGFAQGSGTTVGVTTNPYSLTGLTAATAYDVYLQADCGNGDLSQWVGPISIYTLCTIASAPYLENFDSGLSSCWAQAQNDDFNWTLDANGTPSFSTGPSDDISGGGNYMFIETSSGASGNIATLNTVGIDLSTLTTPQLRFFSHMYGATTGSLNVDVSNDGGATYTQIFTKSGDQGNQWNEEMIDLSSYSGVVHFSVTAIKGSSYTGDIAIDNFEVRETPSCLNPNSLSASNVTNNSLDFGWTAGANETAWNIEYGTSGFTLGTGTLTAVSSNPTGISGLTGNTTYDLYVQADCGTSGVSPWAGPFTVTTLCDAFTAPYLETFDATTTIPSCWTETQTSGSGWVFSGTPGYAAGSNGRTSGTYAWIDFSGTDVGAVLTSPTIDYSSLTTPQLRFFYFSVNSNNADINDLFVEAWDGSAWNTISTISVNNSGWAEHTIALTGPTTSTQFRFRAESGGGSGDFYNDILIDDIEVRETPSCLDPSGLSVSNISVSSADVSWTAGANETAWNVEYGTSGFTLGTGTLSTSPSTSYSVTGLTDLTTYDVYVQADCGGGDVSAWIGPLSFTTPIANGCAHTLNMIDSYGDGWNGNAVDITVNGVTVVSGATIPSGFTGSANFSASTGSTVALANWVTGSYTGEVSWNITDVNGTVIASGVHADLPSVNGNCQPPSFNDPLVGTWKLAQIPGAMGVGPNQGDVSWWSSSLGDVTSRACLFDDSIHFDSTGLYAHFMDANTWVEAWQDGSGDGCRAPVAPHDGLGSYNYYYDSSTNTLTLNGLGAHLGLAKVTNTGEINNPQSAASSVSYILTFSNNGNTMTADIDFGGGWWRFVYDNTSYQAAPSSYNVTLKVNTATITVGPNGMYAGGGVLGDAMAIPLSDADGDGTWEGVAQFPVAGGNYVFLNSPSNGGDWGAKEDLTGQPCGDPNNWNDRLMPSIASDTTVLHCFGSCETDGTCPAPPPVPTCNYTIDMQDSYGDGWNGASVDVAVNGTVVANWGLASGFSGSDSIATINGDVVDFTFNSGAWDSEITFQITDPTGSQLGTYGTSPAVGLFLTDTSAAICQPTTVNVSFQVDMNQVTAAFTTPEVNGSWNNWSAGTPMSDANGDGVWDATIALLSGNYEYKFAADGWTIQEMNDPTASCTNGDPIYTNRVLTVGTVDMVIPNVCWGSCTPCFYSPQPPVGVNCAGNGNPGLAFSDDIVPANGWSGDLGGNGYWNVGSGSTPSGSTGPTGAHSGPDYLYFESSTGGLDTATAVTPMIDLSVALSDAELTFWMHAYGVAIGTLDVGVSTSATGPFTSLYTNTGAVQTPSDPWAQIGINLASYVGQQIYVGFTYIRDVTGATSFQGDLAIDLVEVNACFNCLAPSGLTASNVTATSADVSWTAGGTETEWFLIVNGAGTTQTSTTANLTSLMPNMAYTAQVHAVCAPGDTSAASPAITFNTLCNASLAPTNETFDAGFSNCWSQDTADTFDWTVDAGGTPSGGTGPSDDFTGGGNYMYTEASLPRAYGDVATMYSEVIDISGLTNPELRFLNHMYGDAMGTLEVDLWDASTGTVVGNVFTHTGDRGNQWNEELIMLSTTATLVQFSITATLDSNVNGQTWPGDMAIDEFGVREAAANDLALVAAAVASGCDLTATEPIELWVVNQGLVAESAFDLSYAVNGGTPVVESITSTVNPGDTLKYVFTATADMTADGVYNLDFACVLSTDNDLADNALSMMAENYYTPMAPMSTMGDSICFGDTAYIGATGDGHIRWYDAATAGNLVEEGDYVGVTPSTTTSYYAEAVATEGYDDDFESYTAGDLIAQSSNVWEAWTGPNGGGADDASVSNAQASSGSNSLYLNNADGDDIVLPFGEAFSSGKFFYSMDMYIVTDAYFNFQADVNIGAAWAFDVFLTGGSVDVQVGGTSVLTGAYTGTNPTGSPVWFNIEFEADLNTGTWELFTNGTSQGIFIVTDPVASVNLYANTGNEYYIDDVQWSALKDDACVSATRTEAVVTVLDCSNILELAKGNLDVYPNPNNGLFTISNSEDIVKVTVTDVHGKIVQSINEINLSKVDVDLTELERGMYMINVETNNGTLTESVIVQ